MVSSGALEKTAAFFHPPIAGGLNYELWLRRLPCDVMSDGTAYQFDASPGTGSNLRNRGTAMKESHKRHDRRQTENLVRLVTFAILLGLWALLEVISSPVGLVPRNALVFTD
jgi:hypothetical protein